MAKAAPGFEALDITVGVYLGRARVTGAGREAGCLLLKVDKMRESDVFSLGGVLETKGGMNVRKEPGVGKARWLVVHARKPTGRESLQEEAAARKDMADE